MHYFLIPEVAGHFHQFQLSNINYLLRREFQLNFRFNKLSIAMNQTKHVMAVGHVS